MPEILCRHFTGYKPCHKGDRCDATCDQRSIPTSRILFIHLGAMGAVLRSTSLLAAIHRRYPGAHITWVTQKPTDQLLRDHPLVDRVLTTERDDILSLSSLEFDVAYCVDKSLVAAGVLKVARAKKLFGFRAETITGAILPATDAATYLWELGLSNQKKFFENKKPETQLVTEALELEYQRDPYSIFLNQQEVELARERRARWAMAQEVVVGLNTGCSGVIPYKKLTVEAHRRLIASLKGLGVKVVLLGGPEDRLRNQQIAHGLQVISSPTDQGLRDGLISMQACDIVISGDSLGMHMAIALKKWVVAWFGPTCSHEIDLYDHGVHVLSKAPCGPCWKRSCNKNPMCYDLVDINELIQGVKKGIQWLMSSSTPRLSVISSYPSRSCEESNGSGLISL
jgi:heptosyltransferase-2